MLLTPALGRQRQVDLCEFKASLVYRASSRTGSIATGKPCFEKQKHQQNKTYLNVSEKVITVVLNFLLAFNHPLFFIFPDTINSKWLYSGVKSLLRRKTKGLTVKLSSGVEWLKRSLTTPTSVVSIWCVRGG